MMTRCKNGHYYDDAKYSSCPHCGVDLSGFIKNGAKSGDNEKTLAMLTGNDYKTLAMDDTDDVKTVSFFEGLFDAEPVVGWLVCIKGPEKGRDYRIHAGRSKIGRAAGNDIAIRSDISISKQAHAEIVYDHKTNKTYLMPVNSVDLLLGNKVVTGPVELHDHNLVKLGQTVLVFVPFCSGEYDWEAIDKAIIKMTGE